MDLKEMPLNERYDRLLEDYLLDAATDYVVLKELGGLDKALDLSVKMQKEMLPSILGSPVFTLLKVLAPGRTFRQISNTWLYNAQTWHPLSTIDVSHISDREVTGGIKNCVLLNGMRDIVKKTGLEIDPKFLCQRDAQYFPALFSEFGIDITWTLEENGCRFQAKLT